MTTAASKECAAHVAHAHRGTVLAVDDRPKNVKLLQLTLGGEGYEVIPATSGAQALECVARKIPDVILLDVMMPEMDGFEVCKRLKQDVKTASVAVIFLSAAGDKASIINGFEAGGVDYITKPFTKAELLARVNTHVAFKQLLDRNRSLMQARHKWVADEIENAKRPLIAIARNLEDLSARLKSSNTDSAEHLIKQTLTITTCALGQFNREEVERNLDINGDASADFPVSSRHVEAMISKWYLTSLRKNIGFKFSGLAHEVHANLRVSSVNYLIDLLMAAALNQSKSGDMIHARLHADTGKLQVSLEHTHRPEDPRHPEPKGDLWMDPEQLDRRLLRETERLGGELRVGSGPRGKEVTILSLPLPEGQAEPDPLATV